MKNRYLKTYGGLPKEMYFIFAARVVNCMGSFIVPLLTLILTQKLGMSKTETGNFSALLMLTQGPCLLLGGKLIDTIGRKKLLITCEILGSFFYILCGVLKAHSSMAVFIVIAANLYIMAAPAFDAMVADITTPENRKSAFSLIYLGINVGMTISPLLGGLLFQNYLPLLFILDAVTTLASAALLAVFVKETKNRQNKAPSADMQNDPAENRSVFKVLWNIPILLIFLAITFIYDFTYTQWNFMLPLQFGDLYGTNGARFYSIITALNAFIVISMTPLLTHLTLRFRPLKMISGGGILYVGAFIAFGLVKDIPLFLAAAALFTFGEIIVTINLSTFIADHSPPAYRGRINSIFMFSRGTAGALGPLIMGHVITGTDYFITWSVVAILMLAGAAGMFSLNKKENRPNVSANALDDTM